MRIKRQAKARKSLEFFVRAFSFEEPFKFLIDPDFLLGILKGGLQLRPSLQNLISVKDQDCKIFLTTCVRRELEALSVTPGPRIGEWKGALAMIDNKVNNVQYVACKHPKTIKCTAHQCMKWSVAPAALTAELEGKKHQEDDSDDEDDKKKGNNNKKGLIDSKIVGAAAPEKKKNPKKEKKSNPEHFITCVQHSDLRSTMRTIPAVPTVYLHSNTLVFDEPSQATRDYAERFKISHHHKVSSKQNLSILESLQRYAPEKNQVLESALENGGVYGKAVIPQGIPTNIIQKNPNSGQNNLIAPHIGRKMKPKGVNPLANKKPQQKQMPAMSFKTQKKLEAAQAVQKAQKVLKNAQNGQNNQKSAKNGQNDQNIESTTTQPAKKQKTNNNNTNNQQNKKDKGDNMVQLGQLPKLEVYKPEKNTQKSQKMAESVDNGSKKRKLGQM